MVHCHMANVCNRAEIAASMYRYMEVVVSQRPSFSTLVGILKITVATPTRFQFIK